jgi:hypothetical protein
MSKKKTYCFRLLVSVICIFVLAAADSSCAAQERMEEFNGPFASWANVKTRFGATGNGKQDDTKAIQQALDSLTDRLIGYNSGRTAYTVIYIPPGTYKITSTLSLRGKIGVKIVGANPLTTKFLWQGNDNDTVFWANGSSYFSLSRIGWDAGGRKQMEAIGLHWKSQWQEPQNHNYAPEQVEFTDHIFDGFEKGISGGTLGGNDGTGMNESEITIRRCVFNACTGSGILIRGYNALDYWIWHCRFIKCRVGVTSNSGNYHIYKSYFNQSTLSDVYNINSYYTSVRFCHSENSAAFSLEEGGSSNPFKRIFEGNTVTGITNIGILYTHTGKITMMDNVFKAAAVVNTKKFMDYGTWASTHFDLLDLNNSIQGFPTVYVLREPSHIFKSQVIPLTKAAVTAAAQFVNQLPETPPYRERTLFEVPANSTAVQIQQIIDKASSLHKRAVVHFAYGRYELTQPLVTPVNSDIQITGDGYLYASTLSKPASPVFVNGAVLKIMCPATVSIRDIDIDLTGSNPDNGRAIVLINADQPGSTVLLDQLYSGNDTSLLVKEYDYTLFQKTNSFFTAGNYVSGGKLVQKGTGTSKVQSFGAQFANCTIVQNGTFIARDCWWEGAGTLPVNLKGSGNFVIDGAMIAPLKLDSSVIISVNDFAGKISLMDMYLIGSIEVKKNNPSLQLLAWNLNFYYKKRPLAFLTGNESYKAFFGGISTMCFNNKDPECASVISSADRAINTDSPDGFMDTMTKELRSSVPVEYVSQPAGITNFYLSRVAVSAKYKTGIAFIK